MINRMLSAALAALAAASPAAASQGLLDRAVSCRLGDGEAAGLMSGLAIEDAGFKRPVRHLAAPSGALYRLTAPVRVLGYQAQEIYVAPGRIALVVEGQTPESVSAALRLTSEPPGPAVRQLDGGRSLVAYALHQDGLEGKVLAGCAYDDPSAQTWLGDDLAF